MVNGLQAQGRFALSKGPSGEPNCGCAYLSDDGCRCAIGVLIAEVYDPALEGLWIGNILGYRMGYHSSGVNVACGKVREHLEAKYGPINESDVYFLSNCQRILHDDLATSGDPEAKPLTMEQAKELDLYKVHAKGR